MNTVGCKRSEAWKRLGLDKPLKGEYIVNTEHGRFYEAVIHTVTEKRSWLLTNEMQDHVTFPFEESIIYYVGPLKNMEDIIMAWVKAGDDGQANSVS